MYITHTFNKSDGDGEQSCCLGVGEELWMDMKGSVKEFYGCGGYMNLYMCTKFPELHTKKKGQLRCILEK